jgi:hypothetical protein
VVPKALDEDESTESDEEVRLLLVSFNLVFAK